MIVLTIRTDRPEAEVGLFDSDSQLAYETWPAHKELSATLHTKITEILKQQGKELSNVEGIVCFAGPGSFTGLRIGITVADALAYGLDTPVVATQGSDWIKQGITRLQKGENDHIALPQYGAPAHITQPRK